MAFDFPSSPTVGQQFSPVPGTTYTYNGYGWTSGGNTLSISVQKFTASGTYTPTPGMKYCIIEAIGGGAGGGGAIGGANYFGGGGGGSGGYSRHRATAAEIGASQSVIIGAGGNGGAAGANDGAIGSDTSIGILCIAKGGGGGKHCDPNGQSVGTGGPGGIAGTGNILIAAGNPGGNGTYSTVIALTAGGAGASSVFGGGAASIYTVGASVAGSNAGNYGAGGGGGMSAGGANVAGGNGSTGVVIITEYI